MLLNFTYFGLGLRNGQIYAVIFKRTFSTVNIIYSLCLQNRWLNSLLCIYKILIHNSLISHADLTQFGMKGRQCLI